MNIPNIGTEVTIVCKRPELERKVHVGYLSEHETFRGTIYPLQKWQSGRSCVNLTTGDKLFPWREIQMNSIVSISVENKKMKIASIAPREKIHTIKGSTGNVYTIIESNGAYSCDCIGFKYHGYCKHIKTLKKT